MPELGTSVAVASIIVGLLTMPAASKSLKSSSGIKSNLANISVDDFPKEVTTQASSDSFSRKTDTAFREFETHIASEEAKSSVETPSSRLTVSRTPSRTRSVLKSSRGSLTVTESFGSVNKTVETAYGTLTETEENGEVTESFEGSQREKVEAIMEELEDVMEQKRTRIKERNQKARAQRLAKSLEMEVEEDSPEHLVLNNTGNREVSLDGWKIFNNNPDSYEFSGVSIRPEETLKAYSKDREDLNVTEEDGVRYVYGTGLTWENNGDTAALETGSETEVMEESY